MIFLSFRKKVTTKDTSLKKILELKGRLPLNSRTIQLSSGSVMKLVDLLDSKSCGSNPVSVRFRPEPPIVFILKSAQLPLKQLPQFRQPDSRRINIVRKLFLGSTGSTVYQIQQKAKQMLLNKRKLH